MTDIVFAAEAVSFSGLPYDILCSKSVEHLIEDGFLLKTKDSNRIYIVKATRKATDLWFRADL